MDPPDLPPEAFSTVLLLLLDAALRWRVITVPKGRQVEVVGMRTDGEEIVTPGVVHFSDRQPDGPAVNVMDCLFEGCSWPRAADFVIEAIREQTPRGGADLHWGWR